MEIKTFDEDLKIEIRYKSKAEMKKTVLQKRIKGFLWSLKKVKLIDEPKIDLDQLSVIIKCNEKKIYDHIIKGFRSVT